MKYRYTHLGSRLDGQLYSYQLIDGVVHLTPIGGKSKAIKKMKLLAFILEIENGYYLKIND